MEVVGNRIVLYLKITAAIHSRAKFACCTWLAYNVRFCLVTVLRNLIWWSNTISILQEKLLMPLLYFVAALSIGIWWLLFTFPDSYHFKNDFNSILRPTVIMSYNFTGPFWHVLVHHKDSILLPTESAPAEKTYFSILWDHFMCLTYIFSRL